jgi:hypothetical protein
MFLLRHSLSSSIFSFCYRQSPCGGPALWMPPAVPALNQPEEKARILDLEPWPRHRSFDHLILPLVSVENGSMWIRNSLAIEQSPSPFLSSSCNKHRNRLTLSSVSSAASFVSSQTDSDGDDASSGRGFSCFERPPARRLALELALAHARFTAWQAHARSCRLPPPPAAADGRWGALPMSRDLSLSLFFPVLVRCSLAHGCPRLWTGESSRAVGSMRCTCFPRF